MIPAPKQLAMAFIIILIAFAIAAGLIYLAHDEAGGQDVPPLKASEHDEQLNYLDKQAIEAAYVAQVQKLFAVWMVDYSIRGQPTAALRGHRNARKGFIESMRAIEKR